MLVLILSLDSEPAEPEIAVVITLQARTPDVHP